MIFLLKFMVWNKILKIVDKEFVWVRVNLKVEIYLINIISKLLKEFKGICYC